MVAPSTATTGTAGAGRGGAGVGARCDAARRLRVVISRIAGDALAVPPWATVGLGRQDELLRHADLVVCGGGHGMLSKTLMAGVPMVVVPGGGDQWELANRVVRQGSGRLVRPLTVEALSVEVGEALSSPRYRESRDAGGREHRRGRRSGTGVP